MTDDLLRTLITVTGRAPDPMRRDLAARDVTIRIPAEEAWAAVIAITPKKALQPAVT